MRSLILIAVAAFGLAACQPSEDVATNNYITNNVVEAPASDCGVASETLVDEKVLFAAETAYNVAAHAYVTLDGTGKLPANVKSEARPVLISAYNNLKLARQAYAAADGCSLKQYSDLAQAFANKAKSILPARN